MYAHKHTHTLPFSSNFLFGIAETYANWFIIFAFVHFKLQLPERTWDEKLIGLSDTVMARRSKRWFISFCTGDWGGIIFPLSSIPTHPTVKGRHHGHRQQTDPIFTGFIHTAIPFALAHLLHPAAVIFEFILQWYDLAVPYIGFL